MDELAGAHGMRCADVLPLSWQGGSLPGAAEAARLDDDNVHTLKAVAALEEYATEPADESDPESLEQRRLNDKVNILLEMVGHLLALHASAPAPVAVTLSSDAVEWDAFAGAAPADGARGIVRLYLHRYVPRPLCLAGVARCEDRGDGRVRVRLEFAPLGAPLASALERHVFRRHRRAIAGARRPGGPAASPGPP